MVLRSSYSRELDHGSVITFLPFDSLLSNQDSHSRPYLAFQALVHISNIQKGNDVLIHAGASGVTVAGIQLARLYGACVLISIILFPISY